MKLPILLLLLLSAAHRLVLEYSHPPLSQRIAPQRVASSFFSLHSFGFQNIHDPDHFCLDPFRGIGGDLKEPAAPQFLHMAGAVA